MGLEGKALLAAVVGQIEQHPETHDQKYFHGPRGCGTSHCVAGHAQILSGRYRGDESVDDNVDRCWDDAIKAIGLTYEEAEFLFSATATVEEIREFNRRFQGGLPTTRVIVESDAFGDAVERIVFA